MQKQAKEKKSQAPAACNGDVSFPTEEKAIPVWRQGCKNHTQHKGKSAAVLLGKQKGISADFFPFLLCHRGLHLCA